jgi:hypothetical protein
MNYQRDVAEFMETFGQEVPGFPQIPSQAIRNLRNKLIREENFELERDGNDIVGAADAIGDLLYVVFGAAVAYGIDIEPVFAEIHRSNMSKLWTWREIMDVEAGRNVTSMGVVGGDFHNLYDIRNTDPIESGIDERVYVVTRKDGKVIKSPGYSEADLKTVIEAQIPH